MLESRRTAQQPALRRGSNCAIWGTKKERKSVRLLSFSHVEGTSDRLR